MRYATTLHIDASYKDPKHHVRYKGKQIFKALVTATNEFGVSIQSTLPHINLRLGTKESGFNPCISAIIDTGAALCCGYSGYIMAIAKAYPELVKSITLAKDRYSPIVLNGVISKDDNDTLRYSTNLPAIVEFHLDYQTSTGQPLNFMESLCNCF
jgi:hypothetical protein